MERAIYSSYEITQSKKWYVFVCFLYVFCMFICMFICQKYVFCMFVEMAGIKSMFYVCFKLCMF